MVKVGRDISVSLTTLLGAAPSWICCSETYSVKFEEHLRISTTFLGNVVQSSNIFTENKDFFFLIEFPAFQFLLITSFPVTGHKWTVWFCLVYSPHSVVFIYIAKTDPQDLWGACALLSRSKRWTPTWVLLLLQLLTVRLNQNSTWCTTILLFIQTILHLYAHWKNIFSTVSSIFGYPRYI